MASARPRSPLELPPRQSEQATTRQAPTRPRAEPLPPALELTRMPISFGVLLLALSVTLFMCLSLGGVMYRNAAVRSEEASRATERRLSKEIAQLRAAAVALQAQLDLRAQDIVTQSREIERMRGEFEGLRGRGSFDTRSARARRAEKR